jgi:polyamine oxidase
MEDVLKQPMQYVPSRECTQPFSPFHSLIRSSLGVLQNDAVNFEPPLPQWKREGIETFTMGTYTKIFLQFRQDDIFWDRNNASQFLLYADPHRRGYYPAWEPLDIPGFLPGSGIIFGTITHEEAYRVESQGYEETKKEVLEVLGKMFQRNISEPIAFAYPNWTHEPWTYGTYSNWPQGVSLKMHQNLRANVGRLWFAGEATSAQNFGFLHGAYFEGQLAGNEVASCLHGNCTDRAHYEKLHGNVEYFEYTLQNGWRASTFENNNDQTA